MSSRLEMKVQCGEGGLGDENGSVPQIYKQTQT